MNTQDTFKHIEKYYTSVEYLKRKFDTVSRQLGLKVGSVDEYLEWKSNLRSELRYLSGVATMQNCDLKSELLERTEMGTYTREKIIITTEPGIIMTLYVLIPNDIKKGERRPAVIAAHGHSSAGKFAVAGRTDIPAVAEQIERYNYDYGIQLVKEGFIVFCPDARGFGERREENTQGDSPDLLLNSSCYFLNNISIPLGLTLTGMWTWDLMRLIDYISVRDECNSEKIGCAGLSGGGLQSLWLAALDDRVRCTVISGYFYGYKQAVLAIPNCACNYVPHLWEKVDIGDIAALIAPRPLLIETGSRDPYNGEGGLNNVIPQMDITRKAYGLFHLEDNLYHHIFDWEHKWNGEKAIPWLKRWLFD